MFVSFEYFMKIFLVLDFFFLSNDEKFGKGSSGKWNAKFACIGLVEIIASNNVDTN